MKPNTQTLINSNAPTAWFIGGGAGGGTAGALMAGVLPILNIDADPRQQSDLKRSNYFARCEAYSLNFPESQTINKSVQDVVNQRLDFKYVFKYASPDMIIGSLPCSNATPTNGVVEESYEQDIVPAIAMAELIIDKRPTCGWIENVPNWEKFKACSKYIIPMLEAAGYKTEKQIITVSDFGVPQARKRLFIRYWQKGLKPSPLIAEPLFLGYQKQSWWDAVKDLWGDLPNSELWPFQKKYLPNLPQMYMEHFYPSYFPKTIDYPFFGKKHQSRPWECWDDSFLIQLHGTRNKRPMVALANTPSWTLLANISNRAKTIIHAFRFDTRYSRRFLEDRAVPEDWWNYGEVKTFDARAMARIQSFPDWYQIPSHFDFVQSMSCIGNAVPSKMAQILTESLLPCINKKEINTPLSWLGKKSSKNYPSFTEKIKSFYFKYQPTALIVPFMGSLADVLALRPQQAICSDTNSDLYMFWQWVQEDGKVTLPFAKWTEAIAHHGKEYNDELYYELRDKFNNGEFDYPERAQVFYWLNRHCFNGVFRYNKSGKMNSPYSSNKRPTYITDFSEVKAAIANYRFSCCDWRAAINNASAYDMIYADPPYQPRNKTANFTAYSPSGTFTWSDRCDLAKELFKIKCKAVFITDNATNETLDLYRSTGFKVDLFQQTHKCGKNKVDVYEILASKL